MKAPASAEKTFYTAETPKVYQIFTTDNMLWTGGNGTGLSLSLIHISIDNLIDQRSYERQGTLKVPTIHEGADARKIEEKYLTGQIRKGSWKVEENQMIKDVYKRQDYVRYNTVLFQPVLQKWFFFLWS